MWAEFLQGQGGLKAHEQNEKGLSGKIEKNHSTDGTVAFGGCQPLT